MDILETLQQKREVNRMQQHPLSSLSLNERYRYCFGLAVLAKGNIKTINELAAPFEKICQMLGISKNDSEEMIVDINNHFEKSLDYLVEFLSIERRLSNCFLIDLLKLKEHSEWGSWYCEEVIQQFCYILKIPEGTRHFFEAFLKERSNGDSNTAHELVAQYEKDGNEIDYELLHYMNREYEQHKQYRKLVLDQGGCVRIENPTTVDTDILIRNGTKVYISNTTLLVGGSIQIEEGRVEITNSLLEATGEERKEQYLITATKQHQFFIKDTTIDLHHLCPGIQQLDGILKIQNSMICHGTGGYTIYFTGDALFFDEVSMKDCLGGGLKVRGWGTMELFRCQFENCRAEHGGAIHSSTRESVHVRECTFINCSAKYLGAALYFKYKRYGQQVLGCRFENCEPKSELIFNVYIEKE